VPQVIDSYIVETSTGSNAPPRVLDVGEVGAGLHARDHPGIVLDARKRRRDIDADQTTLRKSGCTLRFTYLVAVHTAVRAPSAALQTGCSASPAPCWKARPCSPPSATARERRLSVRRTRRRVLDNGWGVPSPLQALAMRRGPCTHDRPHEPAHRRRGNRRPAVARPVFEDRRGKAPGGRRVRAARIRRPAAPQARRIAETAPPRVRPRARCRAGPSPADGLAPAPPNSRVHGATARHGVPAPDGVRTGPGGKAGDR